MSDSDADPIRVLFVCLGNICRSPMAEGVFAHKVRAAGLEDRIASDSAGTGGWHIGEPPHTGTRRMLAEKGILYTHLARLIEPDDLSRFDYLLTMDDDNLRAVRRLGTGRAEVRPFLDYAPDAGMTEVPDPYYSGNFGEVFRLVDRAADGLLEAIRREHGL